MNTKFLAWIVGLSAIGIIVTAVYIEMRADSRLEAYRLAAKENSYKTPNKSDARKEKEQVSDAAQNHVRTESDSPDDPKKSASNLEACDVIVKLAKSIMERRQEGVSMADMMDITLKLDENTRKITKGIIIMAYDHPRYSTPEVIERTIRDFENDVYLECVKARQRN